MRGLQIDVSPTRLRHEELDPGAGQYGVQELQLAVGEEEAFVELGQVQVAQDPAPDGARIDAQNLVQHQGSDLWVNAARAELQVKMQ